MSNESQALQEGLRDGRRALCVETDKARDIHARSLVALAILIASSDFDTGGIVKTRTGGITEAKLGGAAVGRLACRNYPRSAVCEGRAFNIDIPATTMSSSDKVNWQRLHRPLMQSFEVDMACLSLAV